MLTSMSSCGGSSVASMAKRMNSSSVKRSSSSLRGHAQNSSVWEVVDPSMYRLRVGAEKPVADEVSSSPQAPSIATTKTATAIARLFMGLPPPGRAPQSKGSGSVGNGIQDGCGAEIEADDP